MKTPFNINRRNPGYRQPAFTLIEMIGTLTVMSILALFLVPVLIRQMDRLASDRERTSLRSIADAVRQSVVRNRYIPTWTNLASTVASELGVNLVQVNLNERKQPRFFLLDPNLSIGGAGVPYLQSSTGSANPPVNVRFLVLSSIGQALTGMSSGVPSAADFNAIWDWNDASTTPPAASGLSGFTRGDDLIV